MNLFYVFIILYFQDFNVELEAAKAFWEEEQQKMFDEKYVKMEMREKEKMDSELKTAIKVYCPSSKYVIKIALVYLKL